MNNYKPNHLGGDEFKQVMLNIRQDDFKKVLKSNNYTHNEQYTIEELFQGLNNTQKEMKKKENLLYSLAQTQEEKDLVFFENNPLPYDKCRRATASDYARYLDSFSAEQLRSVDLITKCKKDKWGGGILVLKDMNILPRDYEHWMRSFVLLPEGGKIPTINNGEGLDAYGVTTHTARKLPNILELYPDAIPSNPIVREIILRKVNECRESMREDIARCVMNTRNGRDNEYDTRVKFYENGGSYLDDFEIVKYGRKNILLSDIVTNIHCKNEFTTRLFDFLKFSLVWGENFLEDEDNPDKQWKLKEDLKRAIRQERVQEQMRKEINF